MKYGHSRSTVNYWKLVALKQLRNEELIPFEIIEKAITGEPDTIDTALRTTYHR